MSDVEVKKNSDDTIAGYLAGSNLGGRLRNIIYVTESGTYEKPAWLKFAIVKIQGASGGRGGIGATAAATVGMVAPPGIGGYTQKKILAADLATSEDITIGAAGAAGAAGNTSGGDGGTTSFGTHCSATGGGGTTGAVAATALSSPGTAGVGVGGDLNISAPIGPACRSYYVSGTLVYVPSMGQKQYLPIYNAVLSANKSVSSAATAGVVGIPGIVVIEEYE